VRGFSAIGEDEEEEEGDLTVFTPVPEYPTEEDIQEACKGSQNMHLLLISDDPAYLNFTFAGLRAKGTKIVEFPSLYDTATIVPFLLSHDHSIIVVRDPRKDVLGFIKSVSRQGRIKVKGAFIPLNVTFWVILDATQLTVKKLKYPKKLGQLAKEKYGNDFFFYFDLAFDLTQYSHVEQLGSESLQYQDQHMLQVFSHNLVETPGKASTASRLFEFKDLKCTCQKKPEPLPPYLNKPLSVGENFLQYYYLSQRTKMVQKLNE